MNLKKKRKKGRKKEREKGRSRKEGILNKLTPTAAQATKKSQKEKSSTTVKMNMSASESCIRK